MNHFEKKIRHSALILIGIGALLIFSLLFTNTVPQIVLPIFIFFCGIAMVIYGLFLYKHRKEITDKLQK